MFLPDYDISMAKPLYPGCDVWMNNPLRPYEACGTSGMKAALNGAANLSIRDGWWDEWFDPAFGWEIPSAEGVEIPSSRDDLEAKALYDIIENEIVPRFYDTDADGLPQALDPDDPRHHRRARARRCWPPGWCATTSPSSTRRPQPRRAGSTTRPAGAEGARGVEAAGCVRPGPAWPSTMSSSLDGDQVEVGAKIHVSALVRLGELSPDDIEVQLVTGRVGARRPAPRAAGEPVPDRRRRRRRAAPLRRLGGGQAGRSDRLHRPRGPHHDELANAAEMGLAALPLEVATPPSV